MINHSLCVNVASTLSKCFLAVTLINNIKAWRLRKATKCYLVEPGLNSGLLCSVIFRMEITLQSNHTNLVFANLPKLTEHGEEIEPVPFCGLSERQPPLASPGLVIIFVGLLGHNLCFPSNMLPCRKSPGDRLSPERMSVNSIMGLTGSISFTLQCFFYQMSVQGTTVSWGTH